MTIGVEEKRAEYVDDELAESTGIEEEDLEQNTSEITYDEQLYPARPRRLRPRANLRGGTGDFSSRLPR